MQTAIEIKEWHYQGDKKIILVWSDGELSANICTANGAVEHIIPACDITMPKEIWQNLFALPFYTQDSWVRIAERNDGSYGLYINSNLRGGGWFTCVLSAGLLGAGCLLISCTGPIGVAASGALINAGIEGLFHSGDSDKECGKAILKGAISGAIMGGAGYAASALKTSTKAQKIIKVCSKLTKTNAQAETVVKAAIGVTGGATAQLLRDAIVDQKFVPKKIAISGVLSGYTVSHDAVTKSLPFLISDLAYDKKELKIATADAKNQADQAKTRLQEEREAVKRRLQGKIFVIKLHQAQIEKQKDKIGDIKSQREDLQRQIAEGPIDEDAKPQKLAEGPENEDEFASRTEHLSSQPRIRT